MLLLYLSFIRVYISVCYVREKGKLPQIHRCLIQTSKSMDIGPNQDKTSQVSF